MRYRHSYWSRAWRLYILHPTHRASMMQRTQQEAKMESGSRGGGTLVGWRPHLPGLSSLLTLLMILALLTAEGDSVSPKKFLMPGETCGYIVDNGDQFKVVSQQIPQNKTHKTSYLPNVSCTIIFRTDPGKRNFLRLSQFEVESSRFCTKDGLYLYDGGRVDENKLLSANRHALCGTTLSLPNYFVSSGHEVTLKFVTDGRNNTYRGFTVLITPFEDTDDCDSGYICHMTKRCITKDAFCNSEYQCEDGSDEPPSCHLHNTGFRVCPWSQWTLLLTTCCIIAAMQWILADTRLFP